MDDVDLANEHAEYFRRKALEGHFGRCRKHEESEVQQYPGGAASIDNGGGTSPGPRGCIDCGRRTDPARLQALPDAVRCIDCQTQKERI